MKLIDRKGITATPGAMAALDGCGQEPLPNLARHVTGDFGEVGEEDGGYNRRDIKDNCGRVLSAYDLPGGQRLWLITNLTEDGRSPSYSLPNTERQQTTVFGCLQMAVERVPNIRPLALSQWLR